MDALIRNWFQGGERYPLLPTRLLSMTRCFERMPCSSAYWWMNDPMSSRVTLAFLNTGCVSEKQSCSSSGTQTSHSTIPNIVPSTTADRICCWVMVHLGHSMGRGKSSHLIRYSLRTSFHSQYHISTTLTWRRRYAVLQRVFSNSLAIVLPFTELVSFWS